MARRILYAKEKSGGTGVYNTVQQTIDMLRPDTDTSIVMNPKIPPYYTGSVSYADNEHIMRSKRSDYLSTQLEYDYTDIFTGDNKLFARSSKDNATIQTLNKSVGIYEDTPKKLFTRSTKFYNRYKLQQYDEALQKGFAHVFFVRPSCNLLQGSFESPALASSIANNPFFSYMLRSSPDVLKQLTIAYGSTDNDFMFSLSNKASSFSLTDEFIGTDSYGKTWTGYKIMYGKNNIESKTAGSFTINFNDDRHFHVYQLHKAWLEYISGCYRGEIEPTEDTIINKILDYATSVYYIITAEDGHTILFWSKYYGVFPSSVPLSQYTWAEGNIIKNPEIDITYQYSFKDDYDPLILTDFNLNARVKSFQICEPDGDPELFTGAKTWVGSPYIELVADPQDWNGNWYYRLNFRRTIQA